MRPIDFITLMMAFIHLFMHLFNFYFILFFGPCICRFVFHSFTNHFPNMFTYSNINVLIFSSIRYLFYLFTTAYFFSIY